MVVSPAITASFSCDSFHFASKILEIVKLPRGCLLSHSQYIWFHFLPFDGNCICLVLLDQLFIYDPPSIENP